MYEADAGIEELLKRAGDETVDINRLADQMRIFVDLHPQWEEAIGRFAVQLAREDD